MLTGTPAVKRPFSNDPVPAPPEKQQDRKSYLRNYMRKKRGTKPKLCPHCGKEI